MPRQCVLARVFHLNVIARKFLVRSSVWRGFALIAAIGWGGSTAIAQGPLISFDDIKRIHPTARDEFVQAFIDAEDQLQEAGITTRLRMAHFLAQIMTETGGLKRLDENMNYSFKTLMRVFSRNVVSESKAAEIANKPREIANWVYGNRLGNHGRNTDDGWNYRGSGHIQLTGRANFRDRGSEVGLPFEQSPDLARQSREGLMAAIAYWKARNINVAADDNDLRRVRILVNGPAAHGYDQSEIFFKRAWTRALRDKDKLGYEVTEGVDEQAAFDQILKRSGLASEDAFERGGDVAAERAEVLKAFQRELGLPVSGQLDDATQNELLQPREWRYRDASRTVPARTEPDLEQTIIFRLDVASSGGGALLKQIEPSTGSDATVADANIVQEDRLALSNARGMYAEYEMGDVSVMPETFVPHAVIGNDDRRAVLDTRDYPARAVVQILFETRTGSPHLCSGAMISKDTVVTAAHCLHSGTSAGQPYRNFRVIPGRNVGAAPFGRCRGREAFLLSGWTTSLMPGENRNYDLGALKLDCEIGNLTGWVGVRALADSEIGLKTSVHGYAADLAPPGRQWISEDEIRALWEFKGFYQNDTYGGTSGSPVFATGTNNMMIGVHTNGLHGKEEPWASHNAFTRITPARLEVIREWIRFSPGGQP